MLTAFERKVAFRYLRARRKEGFISVIAGFSLTGIALGVATLIVVMAVMNGFRSELLGRIIGLNGHISIYSQYGNMPDYETVLEDLRKEAGVKHAIPMVEGQVMVSARGVAQGAQVQGLRVEDLRTKKLVVESLPAEALDALDAGEGVLVGSRLAQKMGLDVGDSITLVSPEGQATFAGMMPRIKAYPIVGLFEVGMYEYDASLVFMPFEEAQIFFKLVRGEDRAVSAIELVGENAMASIALADRLRSQYGERLRIFDWQQSNAHFFNALQVERNVMFLILTLIILVAAFNIISSLIMLVRDKGRDIAILRTMGASRASILRIFFTCGASIGVIGTVLGVVLGLSFALNIDSIKQWLESLTGTELFAAEIYFLSKLPAEVDMREVLQVTGMALALSFLATIYPARRAASLDPAEALRYE